MRILLTVIGVAALAVALISWGSGPGVRAPEDALLDEPTETETAAADSLDDLVPGFAGTIALAVSSPTRRTSEVITWVHDEREPAVRPIEPMTRIQFDAGGMWIAGFSIEGRSDGPASRLFLGRMGARLQPLTEAIRRFAWHETAPAEMAYTTELTSGPEIHVVDLRLGGTTRIPLLEEMGLGLAAWGDWGFAMIRPDPIPHTALVDRQGDLLLADIPGLPLGGVGGDAVGFLPLTGPGAREGDGPYVHDIRAFVIEGARGKVTFPSWARAGEHPWVAEAAPLGDSIALYLTREPFEAAEGSLRIIGVAGGTMEIPGFDGPPAIAWDRTGRWLVAATEGDSGAEVLVVDTHDRTVVTLPPLAEPGGVIQDVTVIG